MADGDDSYVAYVKGDVEFACLCAKCQPPADESMEELGTEEQVRSNYTSA